jgi:putative ABC transport system substrate-binding protein
MRRRDFIAGGTIAAALSISAWAEQSAKLATIGFLGAASPELAAPWVAAFVKRLHELGWTEGHNVAIVYRWAEARSERYSEMATELARLKVDVL